MGETIIQDQPHAHPLPALRGNYRIDPSADRRRVPPQRPGPGDYLPVWRDFVVGVCHPGGAFCVVTLPIGQGKVRVLSQSPAVIGGRLLGGRCSSLWLSPSVITARISMALCPCSIAMPNCTLCTRRLRRCGSLRCSALIMRLATTPLSSERVSMMLPSRRWMLRLTRYFGVNVSVMS